MFKKLMTLCLLVQTVLTVEVSELGLDEAHLSSLIEESKKGQHIKFVDRSANLGINFQVRPIDSNHHVLKFLSYELLDPTKPFNVLFFQGFFHYIGRVYARHYNSVLSIDQIERLVNEMTLYMITTSNINISQEQARVIVGAMQDGYTQQALLEKSLAEATKKQVHQLGRAVTIAFLPIPVSRAYPWRNHRRSHMADRGFHRGHTEPFPNRTEGYYLHKHANSRHR